MTPKTQIARGQPKTQNQVAITRRLVPRGDGTTAVELAISLSEAGVPDRRFFADTVSVSTDSDFVRLSFAQHGPPAKQNVVVIIITVDAVRNLLRHSEDFGKRSAQFLEKNGIPRRHLLDQMPDAVQTVTLMANMVGIAQSGRECCIDLYHLSAWAMRDAQTAKVVDIDPVLRIDAPTSLVVPLLEHLVQLRDKLPNEAVL